MAQNRKTKYHVRKRVFLNRDNDLPAYAIGIVEDTGAITGDDDSNWKYGTVELKFGDCYRRVSFDFSMDTREERARSLYKINRIVEIVNLVRDAIEKEVHSINKRKKIKEKPPKTKN